MFPGLHWPELLIVIAIALLVFGPKRLPEMGSAIGKTIKEFQKSMREVTQPHEAQAPSPLPAATVQPAAVVPPAPVTQISASTPEGAREPLTAAHTGAPTEHTND